MNSWEMINHLKYVIDAIDFYERMKKSHSCNDCGAMEECEYRPEWGSPVRWNCPHWEKG